jgi:hypothetical protein
MRRFGRMFNILRIDIPSPHNNHILDSARHVDFTVVHKAKITGAAVGPSCVDMVRMGMSRKEGVVPSGGEGDTSKVAALSSGLRQ